MNGISEFHFLRPLWLLALPLLLWLVHMQRHHFTRHSAWSDVVAPELLPHLLHDSSAASDNRWLYPLAQLAALLVILALAGPSWRQLPQPVFDTPAHRILVMDLSPAMDAQDLKPSRLKRSQLVAQQLLEQQSEGDTGLVAFAAEAFPVVPLTSDRNTVSHLLHSLSSDIMPASGDNLAAGIRQATELLKQTGASRGDIVVFTASRVTQSARQAADQAYSAGFRLHVLGAGTKKGAPIPAPGGWLKDDKGAITLSRLDESSLRALAQNHGGRYRNVENAGASYQLDLSAELAATAKEDSVQNLQADMWQDEGPWLLLPLLLISAFAFRRGWLMLLLLTLPLSTPQPAYAGWWKKDDQQAYQHYQTQDYANAAETFDDENWKASALYEAGQYQAAAELWKQNTSAQSRYNLGNALARAGELDAAIKAYDEALERNPALADARTNKALVEQLKQQQEQNQQQDGQQDQQQSESEEQDSEQQSDETQQSDGSSQEQQPGEQQDTENSDQGSQSSEQDSEEQSEQEQQQAEQTEPTQDEPSEAEQAQAMADEQDQKQDEQAQAVQQWLKRIPDDPGGLLRRKFERMEQRRREAQR